MFINNMPNITPHSSLLKIGFSLFLLFVGIFLSVCLISYNPIDLLLNELPIIPIRNMGGTAGAYIADILFVVFGVSAYLLPLGFILVSLFVFLGRPIRVRDIICYIAIIVFTSMILHMYFDTITINGYDIFCGGILGGLPCAMISRYVNRTAAYAISYMGLILSFWRLLNRRVSNDDDYVTLSSEVDNLEAKEGKKVDNNSYLLSDSDKNIICLPESDLYERGGWKAIRTLLIVFFTCIVLGPIFYIFVFIVPSALLDKTGIQPQQHSYSKVYSRQEFARLLRGKSPQEVLNLIGQPDTVKNGYGSSFDGDAYFGKWTYYYRTKDPLAKQVDIAVIIEFHGSRAIGFTP